MNKILSTMLLTLGLIAGGFTFSSPAEAAGGCVTKNEYSHLYGFEDGLLAAKKFGTKGTVLRDYYQYMTQNDTVITYNDDGSMNSTVVATRYYSNAVVIRYNKCHHWGHRKYVKIRYESWWAPVGDPLFPAGYDKLWYMPLVWDRA